MMTSPYYTATGTYPYIPGQTWYQIGDDTNQKRTKTAPFVSVNKSHSPSRRNLPFRHCTLSPVSIDGMVPSKILSDASLQKLSREHQKKNERVGNKRMYRVPRSGTCRGPVQHTSSNRGACIRCRRKKKRCTPLLHSPEQGCMSCYTEGIMCSRTDMMYTADALQRHGLARKSMDERSFVSNTPLHTESDDDEHETSGPVVTKDDLFAAEILCSLIS